MPFQLSQQTIHFKLADLKVKITGSEWVHKSWKTRAGEEDDNQINFNT